MRAMEMRNLFSGVNYDAEKNYKCHLERMKKVKKCVDNGLPAGFEARNRSPNKKLIARQTAKENIYRENFFLAKRIFDIMEGESPLSEMINDTRHLDNHPGTMNFKARLEEAQRIHYHNMILASRLNSVQPHYKSEELSVVRPMKSPRGPSRSRKTRFLRELEYTLRMAGGNGQFHTAGSSNERAWTSTNRQEDERDEEEEEQILMDKEEVYSGDLVNNVMKDQDIQSSGHRPRSVILEYTKVQDGRVLDVAVVKEPYRDRYIVYGKDIEDGQRFELLLTSEDVSNILDGDILVTSVDNVEVWMALLHKVDLQPVAQFSKLMTNTVSPAEAELSRMQKQLRTSQENQNRRIPTAPEPSSKPSSTKSRASVRSRSTRYSEGKGSNKPEATRGSPQAKERRLTSGDDPIVEEIDKNLVRVEEAANTRLKLLAKEKKKPTDTVIPLTSRTEPETTEVPKGDKSHRPTLRTTPMKVKEGKHSSSRQESPPRASFDAYTAPSQPLRKSVIKTQETVSQSPTSSHNPHNAAVSPGAIPGLKPKPPNSVPSTSYPAVQSHNNGKRNKSRHNTVSGESRNVPKAIAEAVRRVESSQPSPSQKAKREVLPENVKKTVEGLISNAISEAITTISLKTATAANATTIPTDELVVPRVPFNTRDYHETSHSMDSGKQVPHLLFPSVEVDKTAAASPLHRLLNEKTDVPKAEVEKDDETSSMVAVGSASVSNAKVDDEEDMEGSQLYESNDFEKSS